MKRQYLKSAALAFIFLISCQEDTVPSFDITFTPAQLDFGKVEKGTTIDTLVTLTNPESSTGDFSGYLEIMDSPGFTFDHSTDIQLLKGESKSINVSFNPTANQKYEGRFTLINQERDLDYFYVMAIKGEGVGPVKFSLSDTDLKFGLVTVSKDLTLSINNYSNSGFALEVVLSGIEGEFSLPDQKTSYLIDIGQSVDIPIRYTPESRTANSTLIVHHNSSVEQNPILVTLSGNKDETEAIQLFINDGWNLFQDQDYENALIQFNAALEIVNSSTFYDNIHGEVLLGRGWANAFNRNYEDSREDLSLAYNTYFIDTNQSKLDVATGLTLVELILGRYEDAITHASYILNESSNFQFTYKSDIDHKDVRLARAQSYFNSGDFSKAASDLDILDPSNAPHSSDPRILLEALQSLSGSF